MSGYLECFGVPLQKHILLCVQNALYCQQKINKSVTTKSVFEVAHYLSLY